MSFPPRRRRRVLTSAVQRAEARWQQGESDRKQARRRMRHDAPQAAFLSVQAALNVLASVLEAQGRVRLPHHSPRALLDECVALDPGFAVLGEACAALEAVAAANPFASGEDANREDAEQEALVADRLRARQAYAQALVVCRQVRRYRRGAQRLRLRR